MKRRRIALLEPWEGGSHGAWSAGLAAHSTHDVKVIGLPDRAWRWRLRAAAPWFAEQVRQMTPPPDVILVSGLIDVAVLRGLVGRTFPVVLYMHESQAAYPRLPSDDGIEAAVRNWTSMLAADEVWFNSHFHQRIAIEGFEALERQMPAEQRVAGRKAVAAKSSVVYPGVDLGWVGELEQAPVASEGAPTILWPHRWEDDKNPSVFARALDHLTATGLDFRLVLAGEEGLVPHPARQEIQRYHGPRLRAIGPFNPATYRSWLGESDIVVSCTAHEFFGIAIVEALAAGCVPVLPDDFSYPELLGSDHAGLYHPGTFGTALEDAVAHWPARIESPAMTPFSWPTRVTDYDARLAGL